MNFGKKEGVFGILIIVLFLLSLNLISSGILDSESNSNSEWKMFGRYLNHTGYYNKTIKADTLLWNYTGFDNFYYSFAIAYDIIYFGAHNTFYALNATNGTQIWNYTTNVSNGGIENIPAVANGIVYFTSSSVAGGGSNFYALNAIDGSYIWNYYTTDAVKFIYNSPVVYNNIVYFASDSNKLYAVNATNGTQIWNYTNVENTGSSTIGNDIIYFGSSDSIFYALNATNGTQIWNYTNVQITSISSTIGNDIIYFGSSDSIFYALNATNGTQIWNYTTGGNIHSSPAMKNDIIYFGSRDNTFYAVNATNGTQIWNYTTGDNVDGSPIILDDVVYFYATDGSFYALNATNGSYIWNYTGFSGLYNTPAVANDIIYMGRTDIIYAFYHEGNNYICSDASACEYQNLNNALLLENNTINHMLYILENNTAYSINQTTEYLFSGGSNIINFTNLYNVSLDCNGTTLESTNSNLITINNIENMTLKNCIFDLEGVIHSISIHNSKGINIFNNTFYNGNGIYLLTGNVNIINNTFNESGNQTTGFFMSYSPFTYNNGTATIKFDTCVRILSGASTFQSIIQDNTRMTDPDGIVHYKMWLFQDDNSPVLGCGSYANATLWVASDYVALTCDSAALGVGGKCYYNNTYAFEAKGATSNYEWNNSIINSTLYIIGGNTTPPKLEYNGYFFQTGFPIDLQGATNINITGNKFYNANTNMSAINVNTTSGNITLWYNNFYASGLNETLENTTGCYNSIGNFYDYRIPYSKMASRECGLINITNPTSQSLGNPINITWTAQSSYNTITYMVEYVLNNVRTTIGTTNGLSYLWNAPYAAGQNYTINIIPQGSNGTNRNSTVVVATPEQTEGQPGSGPSRNTLPEGIRLEKAECFRINITELNLSLIQDESKTEILEMENPLQTDLIIKIIPKGDLVDIIKPSENYFMLKSGKTKVINLEVTSKESGVYKGIISIVCDKCQKIIDVTVNVEAKQTSEVKEQIEKSTLMDKIREFFIWIGKLITSLINWFKALF